MPQENADHDGVAMRARQESDHANNRMFFGDQQVPADR
jgi:hypothetical protein